MKTKKEKCKSGHLYKLDSFYMYRGARVCRECERIKHQTARRARYIPRKKFSALEKFAQRVKADKNGCWIWQGGDRGEYGVFSYGNERARAHRWIYEHTYGKIGENLHVDHLCEVKRCVYPGHLEAVSLTVNVQRAADSAKRKNNYCRDCNIIFSFEEKRWSRRCWSCHKVYSASLRRDRAAKKKQEKIDAGIYTPRGDKKTHCVHGHEYSNLTTYKNSKGHRSCLVCRQLITLRAKVNRRQHSASKRLQQTHCKAGHEFTVNTIYRDKFGTRHCSVCMRTRSKLNRQRKAADKRQKALLEGTYFKPAKNSGVYLCPQGHRVDLKNVIYDKHGRRRCEICRKKNARDRYQRQKARLAILGHTHRTFYALTKTEQERLQPGSPQLALDQG